MKQELKNQCLEALDRIEKHYDAYGYDKFFCKNPYQKEFDLISKLPLDKEHKDRLNDIYRFYTHAQPILMKGFYNIWNLRKYIEKLEVNK